MLNPPRPCAAVDTTLSILRTAVDDLLGIEPPDLAAHGRGELERVVSRAYDEMLHLDGDLAEGHIGVETGRLHLAIARVLNDPDDGLEDGVTVFIHPHVRGDEKLLSKSTLLPWPDSRCGSIHSHRR